MSSPKLKEVCLSKILVLCTGSIAAYKTAELVSGLMKQNHEVQVALSESAQKFVGAATFEGLTGRPVLTDLWQSGQMMGHIHWQRWADLIITAPATANTISEMATGQAGHLGAALFLAHDWKKPWLVAPTMNHQMWHHPATQMNIKTLQNWGVQILTPETGALACGETGEGRLMEPEQIMALIEKHLHATKLLRGRRILVTAGGTSEPIDSVRVITNRSTGQTGIGLAEHLARHGAAVTLLRSQSSREPQSPSARDITQQVFATFADLQKQWHGQLQETWDAIVHAAAVSDFSVVPQSGKLSSGQLPNLHWTKNPKLVEEPHKISHLQNCFLIAFKMTATDQDHQRREAVQSLFQRSHANLVVHNDLAQIEWGTDRHQFSIHDAKGGEHAAKNRAQLNEYLTDRALKYWEAMT